MPSNHKAASHQLEQHIYYTTHKIDSITGLTNQDLLPSPLSRYSWYSLVFISCEHTTVTLPFGSFSLKYRWMKQASLYPSGPSTAITLRV
jgi:hypothetical protein